MTGGSGFAVFASFAFFAFFLPAFGVPAAPREPLFFFGCGGIFLFGFVCVFLVFGGMPCRKYMVIPCFYGLRSHYSIFHGLTMLAVKYPHLFVMPRGRKPQNTAVGEALLSQPDTFLCPCKECVLYGSSSKYTFETIDKHIRLNGKEYVHFFLSFHLYVIFLSYLKSFFFLFFSQRNVTTS